MSIVIPMRKLIVIFCLSVLAIPAFAAETELDLNLPAGRFYNEEAKSILLAENDELDSPIKRNLSEAVTPAAEFEPKLFTSKKVHQYLGIGTLMLAGLTMMTA